MSFLNDLNQMFSIVDPKTGKPTDYFMRLLRDRGRDSLTLEEQVTELNTTVDTLEETVDTIDGTVFGTGTGLSGGGTLGSDDPIDYALDADLDDLSDVDTTTTPPTDGQALVWVDADSLWKPGDVASGGGGSGGSSWKKVETVTLSGTEQIIDVPDSKRVKLVVRGMSSTSNTRGRISLRTGGVTSNLSTLTFFSSNTTSVASNQSEVFIGGSDTTGDINAIIDLFAPRDTSTGTVYESISWSGGTVVSRDGLAPAVDHDSVRFFLGAGSFDGGQVEVWELEETSGGGGGTNLSAFVEFTNGSSPTIAASKNVSSVTRLATGRYRITFSSPMPNDKYVVSAIARYNTSSNDTAPVIGVSRRSGEGKTTTHVDIVVSAFSGGVSDNIDFVNVGIFDSESSGGGGGGAYEFIGEAVATGGETSLTLSSIPADYEHLELVGSFSRTTSGAAEVAIRFNNDSASVYEYVRHWGGNSSNDSYTNNATSFSDISIANGTANEFEMFQMKIAAYKDTNKFTAFQGTSSLWSGSGRLIVQSGGQFKKTDTVTRIDALIASGAFAAGSKVQLWGVKA